MSEETPPAAEPKVDLVAEVAAQETPKPESPSGSLREQVLQLVSDENKSQVASLLRSLLEHSPAAPPDPSNDKKEEQSSRVSYRHARLPFKPLVVKEEPPREGANYGSIADD